MTREGRLRQGIAYVLGHVEEQPEGAVAADWTAYFLNDGGLVAHGVKCFHFQAQGLRTPEAVRAIAAWDAAVRLDEGWPKAAALAAATRDLLLEEDRHQARRRARREHAR
ncbi:hypothetical protein ACIQWR_14720 [Streptomyces sp. NPDC098789]|uniref:hypothetical protein n=1 Tax=Streptomyces sp. NPDC098789 TaxID=3366098 RepID=UPI0037FB1380